MMYDIIGDVHGHAKLLKKLLSKLGYSERGNSFFHRERKAVFVGDFINRGSQIRETISIIRDMVENDNALAILGNHEVNAIIYYLKDEKGNRLVPRLNKSNLSLIKTIQQFNSSPNEWKSHRKWLRTLPFFLDLDSIRVVHACWMDENINKIKEKLGGVERIKKSVFRDIFTDPECELGKCITESTKGISLKLPNDLKLRDNYGVLKQQFRMKWWKEPVGKTFRSLSFENRSKLPKYTVPPEIIPKFTPYPDDAPIVFFGHYCKAMGPHIIRDNVCCVDSCVTGTKSLTAYFWQGEEKLKSKNLITVF